MAASRCHLIDHLAFEVILFEAAGVETTHQKIVSGIVVTLSLLITVFAAWWIYHKMALAKPIVLARRRKEKYDWSL